MGRCMQDIIDLVKDTEQYQRDVFLGIEMNDPTPRNYEVQVPKTHYLYQDLGIRYIVYKAGRDIKLIGNEKIYLKRKSDIYCDLRYVRWHNDVGDFNTYLNWRGPTPKYLVDTNIKYNNNLILNIKFKPTDIVNDTDYIELDSLERIKAFIRSGIKLSAKFLTLKTSLMDSDKDVLKFLSYNTYKHFKGLKFYSKSLCNIVLVVPLFYKSDYTYDNIKRLNKILCLYAKSIINGGHEPYLHKIVVRGQELKPMVSLDMLQPFDIVRESLIYTNNFNLKTIIEEDTLSLLKKAGLQIEIRST